MFRLVALLYALFLGAILLDALYEAPAGNYVLVASGVHRATVHSQEVSR
jgi:hypothetical protein